MKKIVSILLLTALSLVAFSSCKNKHPQEEQKVILCQRNEYSKNGVDSVIVYEYKTKEGEIDRLSKSLRSIQRYDSLGNVVYYRGEYYPSVKDVSLSTYHYEIRDDLDLPWDMIYTYKLEYADSVFQKASVFNEEGRYIARIEHNIQGNLLEDSVYVNNRLIYVRHTFKDTEWRDSVVVSYDDAYNHSLSLESEVKSSYTRTGNTVREDYTSKRRNFLRPTYYTSSNHYDVVYDDLGRIIETHSGSNSIYTTYNEKGFATEVRMSNDNSLIKAEYYDNELEKCSYTYSDMSVLSKYTEFIYSFHPYVK